MLVGTKYWSIVTEAKMQPKDWASLALQGSGWRPGENAVLLVLERDDILLMPPGVRAL